MLLSTSHSLHIFAVLLPNIFFKKSLLKAPLWSSDNHIIVFFYDLYKIYHKAIVVDNDSCLI